jgi:hypothetical protein
MGKGREMGRSVYEQPGNEVDGILSQQGGFQVSKGKRKGKQRGMEKGKAESKGLLYDCTVTYDRRKKKLTRTKKSYIFQEKQRIYIFFTSFTGFSTH